jgi:hypothetical protein
VRLLIEPFRNDRADADRLTATFNAFHSLLGARRALALEVHLDRRRSGAPVVWFAVVCPDVLQRHVHVALARSYPNVRLRALHGFAHSGLVGLGLSRLVPLRAANEPPEGEAGIEPLLLAMAAAGAPATVRLLLRPAARVVELALSSAEHPTGPLLWAEPLVLARDRARAHAIASVLAAGPPRLVARRLRRQERRSPRRSPGLLYRPAELARMWSLPAPEFSGVPCLRRAIPVAPAPPGIERPRRGAGLLRDEHGPVTIATPLRRQHVAVVGGVEHGKTSFLVASTAEDLGREDCAVIVLDPKGDAAEAILSIVPPTRTCTLLDMAAPTAGFNPLSVRAAPDAIADHVVAALRSLFDEGEVRGSSDRYLRNALIAVLACGGSATLWDVARLLEVGDGGRAFRSRVAERLVELPQYAEVAAFLAEELPAQLADARATTTAKLDAPANKLARVLNSPAVKRVLLNDSLRIDFDRLIERREVLVVRGALGEIGAGNVAVLMQLLLGMLDAALGRLQDRVGTDRRGSVALKVDEAPLVINPAFAQTLALKRSAGLETVACWQTDAQWEPALRDQLDALFAHRVLFATASVADARAASSLLLAEYSDQLRAGDEQLACLASPDVRLHLPRHVALASWTTVRGRERPFIALTLPLSRDPDQIAEHARRQRTRGGRLLPQPQPPPALVISQPPSAAAIAVQFPAVRPPAAQVAVPRSPAARLPEPGPRAAQPAISRSVGESPRPRSPRPAPRSPAPRLPEPGPRAPQPAISRSAAESPRRRSPRPAPRSLAARLPEPGPRAAQPAIPRSLEAQSPEAGSPGPALRSPSSATPPPSPTARLPPAATASPSRTAVPAAAADAPPSRTAHRASAAAAASPSVGLEELPPSYAELLAFDDARRSRWLPVAAPCRRPVIHPPDRELLGWLIAARCALSSQIHRRMHPERALTTTQRAVKRLADEGMIARFQLHRDDGGGVPLGCAATEAAMAALGVRGRRAPTMCEDRLAALRRDVHVVGWLLALEATAGDAVLEVLGPGRAAITPGASGPADLRFEPGLRPRDFLVTAPDGSRAAVERFTSIKPDAVVALDRVEGGARRRRSDLLVVFDGPRLPALLEAFDHLLAGWWRSVERYRRTGAPPSVVVVCRDEESVRARVVLADRIVTACLAEIGVAPDQWARPGRAGIRFAAESDMHRASLRTWRLPGQPAALRGTPDCGPIAVELLQSPGTRNPAASKPRWR